MNPVFSQPRTRWTVAAALAVAVAAGAFWIEARDAQAADNDAASAAKTGKDGKKPAEPPVSVRTAAVKVADMPIFRAGIGTVTPNYSVTVKARVDGQLESVGFTEGQDVRKGQVLARLDPRTLNAQVLQAQGTLAKDQATLANARTDLQRYATLIAQDAATQQQYDTQKALVSQLEATVKSDAAAVNYAQVELDYATITAPISGRAGARLVDPGNIVHAADTNGLVVINQIDPITVLFTLPDDAVQAANQALAAGGKPPVVRAYARDTDQPLATGALTLVNNQIDTTSGTVQMKATFANPAHTLWPGEFVNTRLFLGAYPKALTIPEAAVQRSQAGVYAYVVNADGQTVRNQALTLTQIEDGVAIVKTGLSAGDKVVVDGQYKLKPGSRIVEVAAAASAGARSAASSASASRQGAQP